MTDYTHSTGSSGTMMIRDTGSWVEFWLNANNSSTWSDHIPWSGEANGSVGGSFYYHPGGGWQKIDSWLITTNQTVTFAIGNTGTSGFGGPTSFNVAITRSDVPDPPSAVRFSNLTSTSLTAKFTDGDDNGSAIDQREVIWGTTTDQDDALGNSKDYTGASTNITGLTAGTTYYFWGRTSNDNGWGDWSPRSNVTMLSVPAAPSNPVLSNVTPVSVDVSWTPNGTGGSPITGFEIGYGTNSTTPDTVVSATSPQTISNLIPSTIYYFWVRAKNAIGTSEWSGVTSNATIAGMRLNVAGVWKVAVPYVRVSGVWKHAIAYTKVAGEWKGTA